MKRTDDGNERREAALKQGRSIIKKRYRNPSFANKPLKENVETESGNPSVSPTSTVDRRRVAKKAMDQFLNRGVDISKLPRASARSNEIGNPKEDLGEISAQLTKASKLHGNQSKRVSKIAEGMKSETGNPYTNKRFPLSSSREETKELRKAEKERKRTKRDIEKRDRQIYRKMKKAGELE